MSYGNRGPETRESLSKGIVTAALCHPPEPTSAALIDTMVDVASSEALDRSIQKAIPFEIVTPDTI